ncbi:MAG: hypothetical protein HC897_15920 [Thermoanaerobaculia bacterium]|nr:hypothetical protein [Thermoanaerobaculia bacterium]
MAWNVELDGTGDAAATAAVRATGATPWLSLLFRTPSPLLEHLDQLDRELKELARLAKDSAERTHFQIEWSPTGGESVPDAKQYAFLLKRAAVAITGAQPEARVISAAQPADPERLQTLYGEELAAYLDGVAFAPAERAELDAAFQTLTELDPGKPFVVDARPLPEPSSRALVLAADDAKNNVALTFFAAGADTDLAPFKLLARELQGDLSFDPYSVPNGGAAAWTFVRGDDLGLRVIVDNPENKPELILTFSDPQLRSPERVDLANGEDRPIFDQRRSADGLVVTLVEPGPVALLHLERMTAAELSGIEEKLTVESERQLPVEEILRRLQAFEDAQARKLQRYQATNTMHLRFRLGNGVTTIEATFEGDFFFRRGQGFDWAWQNFYLNGVKWKGKKLPEIPLVQPEKAAALPLEILFTPEYRYRLRGTGEAEGRDCWVVDFEPIEVVAGRSLYQGTVWIDRQIFARVKTRALQVGLEGDVISNEETVTFSPIDLHGQPAAWSPESYFLPLRVVGQQLFSILNATTQVERETTLTGLQLNGDDFDTARQAALDSSATMVRDTDQGLRYLVKNENGEREVKEGFDTNKLFLVGGAFYDASLDYPLPLAGVNYLSLDFRGTGNQLNVFFAGALLTANYAEPRLFGSKWDAGANLFGFFIPLGEEQFRAGEEIEAEALERQPARAALFLGRPLGAFTKLDFTYVLRHDSFSRADDTSEEFILPESTFTHTFQTELAYTRAGWRAAAQGSFNKRADWRFWGLPGNAEFDPEQEDYVLWNVSLAKTWWLPKFLKLGVEVEHLDGSDLDRFSKYDFSFSAIRGCAATRAVWCAPSRPTRCISISASTSARFFASSSTPTVRG